ncbi:MAG: hypothetical protein QM755_17125 [Luteolibacter sp.]
MTTLAKAVTIHPYFQIYPGKIEDFVANMTDFTNQTSTEKGCLYYNFTLNGDEAFCREGYVDGDAALAHLANVDAQIKRALELSTMTRLEIHGPAEELEKMRGPLAGLNPAWFVCQTGLEK